ncbi:MULTISPECIES: glycosyltransferase family 4 protein [Methylomonas]|nr:glycosyltransferase family 4 protein [Methylomonas koyamae]
MKKILLTGNQLGTASGIATHLENLISAFHGSDCQFIHFCTGSPISNETKLGKSLRLFLGPLRFVMVLFRERPGLVHINTSMDNKGFFRDSIFVALSKVLGRPVVLQLHAGLEPDDFFLATKCFLSRFRRMVLKHADVVVLLTQREMEFGKSFCQYKKLMVVPNAIDSNLAVKPKSISLDAVRLLYIGRLTREKGILQVIEALSELKSRGYKNIYLDIAGEGPFENELKQVAEALKLEDECKFLGLVTGNIKQLLWEKASLFVFPTYFKEGLPYALLEALASATPSITTAAGGIPEIIVDKFNGLIIQPLNMMGVVHAVEFLVKNPEIYSELSSNALVKARTEFDLNSLRSSFQYMYNDIWNI